MRTIPFGKPIFGDEERRAVAEVLEGTTLVHGPRVKQFEADFAAFTGAPHALSVASCTAGLHLALFDLGIGPGDEVIVPAQTHVATAHSVEFTGAASVFADAEPRTGNIDLEQVEAAVTGNTRAIAVVHYLGLPVDMDGINAIARKHDLFVLEDCALAIGTYYKGTHAGLCGDAGCYSFYPVKHMTTAEGGMVITKHDDVAARLDKKRAFGVDRVVGTRKMPGIYDVTMLGYNYRMNELEGALGCAQLARVPGFLEARNRNYAALEKGLAEIDEIDLFWSGDADYVSSRYCLSMILADALADRRADLVNALKAEGVGTSVYYPKPVPHMTYYAEKYGHGPESFPVAARISYQGIALPVGPHLDEQDMDYIVNAVKKALHEVKHG
ncbi:MAG: DegT/DnrJ/EryC1/StrS family aminotransferase [Desulfovibrionaceae bacterium]|jgi:dTDP-4-amino-4,6-dideoxygalactose transaminase|nr:DegT/DnrJ/EryC1/StrS family aminotransferase [Desulfovibrionaceae bacterium]